MAVWHNIVFVDFEASSLDMATSWPVEVGIAWIEDNQVRSWGSLIRPHEMWPLAGWHACSSEVHGITLSQLQVAPAAAAVAKDFIRHIDGRVVVSEQPGFDLRWARRLLNTLGGPHIPFVVSDFDAAISRRLPEQALKEVYGELDRIKTLHRAEADARRLAEAVRRALGNATPERS